MSIENFCSKFPESSDIKTTISTEIKEGMSLVAILAEQLAKEGRDGLRERIGKLNPGTLMFNLTPEDFRQILKSPEDKEKALADYASIIFGLSVVLLERTLVEREYNHKDWDPYGVYLFNIQSRKEESQKLSPGKLTEMYSIVEKDKTFGLFFEEEGIQAMPDAMRQLLEENDVLLPIIRKQILPLYRARAQFLVAP